MPFRMGTILYKEMVCSVSSRHNTDTIPQPNHFSPNNFTCTSLQTMSALWPLTTWKLTQYLVWFLCQEIFIFSCHLRGSKVNSRFCYQLWTDHTSLVFIKLTKHFWERCFTGLWSIQKIISQNWLDKIAKKIASKFLHRKCILLISHILWK